MKAWEPGQPVHHLVAEVSHMLTHYAVEDAFKARPVRLVDAPQAAVQPTALALHAWR